jgi:copper(I)-binding protein
MMPVDSAPVGAGDSLVFAENARHLMVNGLRRKLAAGDSLPITLTFTGGRTLNVAAVVKSPY